MPKQQILSLDPSTELTFRGPFTEYVTSNLELTNPTDRPVFFKVKTTAPRFYCVRPNSGFVKPSETATINVTLQPVESIATLVDERARHKFMIQTAYAPNDDVAVDSFWKSVESSEVSDSKLRVLFLGDDGEPIEAPEKDANVQSSPQSPVPSAPPASHYNNSGGDAAAATTHTSNNNQTRDYDRLLQKEVELRKMYQDEKNKLERENNYLLDKLDKLARSAGNVNFEGLPLLHVILVAILALLIGTILGKLVF